MTEILDGIVNIVLQTTFFKIKNRYFSELCSKYADLRNCRTLLHYYDRDRHRGYKGVNPP